MHHDRRLTRRSALAWGGGLLLSAATLRAAQATTTAPHPTDPDTLDRAFDDAAERYGVPRDLLVALSYGVSRLNSHDHAPSQAGGYGVMHLVRNPGTDTLGAAAAATGLSLRSLRSSDAANVFGGAAVLRAEADRRGLTATDRDSVDAWYPAVARYSQFANPAIARLEAEAVYDTLRAGFAPTPVTYGIGLDSRAVTPQRGAFADIGTARNPIGVASDDYPPAHWVAAHGNGYAVADRPSSHAIDRVVVHVMQGYYAGTISWFQNPDAGVAAHYNVRSSDGDITQMVRDKDIGWHANSFNSRSIGIEHEGWVDDPSWFSEAMYRASADLTAHLCDRYGLAKNRTTVVGHSEVPDATHTDPGPNWDWAHYMSLIDGAEPPAGTPFQTWATAVNVRAEPTTASAVVGNLANPTTVYVDCQAVGETVDYGGYTNDLWARLTSPVQGYISNIFIQGPASLPVDSC